MMYPRLFLARQLLREDGVICVSIDDHEVHHLRMLMNEAFGEENLVSTIVVQSNKRGQTYKDVSKTHEYLILFSCGEARIWQAHPAAGSYESAAHAPAGCWAVANCRAPPACCTSNCRAF
jgi:adenine-specific DNA-methyltransferase